MLGLARTSASAASLLLNLETAFTACLAWAIFGERATTRLALGIALVLFGGAVLSWPNASFIADAHWHGSLLIAAACLAWGFDNNLSQRISDKDPVSIAAIKGLFAGPVNIGLALAAGARISTPVLLAKAGLVGFLCYGLSLVCFMLSLRRLGSARTSLYFALAPFFGAAAGILFLHDVDVASTRSRSSAHGGGGIDRIANPSRGSDAASLTRLRRRKARHSSRSYAALSDAPI